MNNFDAPGQHCEDLRALQPLEETSGPERESCAAQGENAPVLTLEALDLTDADLFTFAGEENEPAAAIASEREESVELSPDAEEEPETDAPAAEPTPSYFSSLGLPKQILKTLQKLEFRTPTAIQERTIPLLLAGRDVVGIAQTGTGKTAAFGLPILARCDETQEVQALILAPTRELAQQSAAALETFARGLGLNVVAVYGGAPYPPQIRALKQGAQIVVGTPGRVMDLMEKGVLSLTALRFLVLDEADEMLRMGFAEDVDQVASASNPAAQRALFSATMPEAIRRVAHKHLHEPVEVSVAPQSSVTSTVTQTYAVVPFKFKSEALQRVLAASTARAAIVFVRTRIDAEQVGADLVAAGFKAATISGDVAQKERENIVARLKTGDLDVLVATDVAARGLDVERIELVVNYDVPRENEAYVHRIGRTGRAGRAGVALTFFTPRERARLHAIEHTTGTQLELVRVPSPAQVQAHRAQTQSAKLPARIKSGELGEYRAVLEELVETNGLNWPDVAAAALALAAADHGLDSAAALRARRSAGKVRYEETVDDWGRFVCAVFEEGRDKARSARKERKSASALESKFKRAKTQNSPEPGMVRYRVEVGRKDRVKPAAIVGAITGEGGVAGHEIGHIDILPSFSLVEISRSLSKEAVRKIGRAKVRGRELRLKEDRGPRR